MQISSTNYQQNFKARIPKSTKNLISNEVKTFIAKQDESFPKFSQAIGSVIKYAPSAITLTELGMSVAHAINRDYASAIKSGGIGVIFGYVGHACNKTELKNAVTIGQTLKTKGFNQAERIFGIKQYLAKRGDPLFSRIFSFLQGKKIKDLAS